MKEDLEKEKEKESEIIKDELLYDNHENIIKSKKAYCNKLNEINSVIKKLVEFGWNEERLLKADFYNSSFNFVHKLLNCIDVQKKNYENQCSVIEDLNKIIKSEKKENFYLEPQEYSLHCLSIYMNNKTNIRRRYSSNAYRQKGEFDNEIYKNLTIENIGNIIKEIQKNGIVVKKEDLEYYDDQRNISFIEDNIKRIFNSSSKPDISKEDKNKIIELFNIDKEYILFFLQKLNNDRSRGGKLNINTYNLICELFKIINDIVLEKEDYDCFKFISIISMTYYKIEGEKKIYIYEHIKDHPYFQKLEFWEKYLQTLINYDINSKVYRNQKDIEEKKLDKEEEKTLKINLSTFSNALTVINNMIDFGLQNKFVEDFINLIEKKYNFSSDQLVQIDYVSNLYKEKNNVNEQETKDEDKNNITPNNTNNNNDIKYKDNETKENNIVENININDKNNESKNENEEKNENMKDKLNDNNNNSKNDNNNLEMDNNKLESDNKIEEKNNKNDNNK